MTDPYSPFYYTDEERRLLIEHDRDEVLHPFVGGSADMDWMCNDCGDTAEGLMHNNTHRNVEPLMEDYDA